MEKTGNRFGEIAVREGFASRAAVRECLEIQAKLKSFGVEPKRLGEIMVEKEYLAPDDVQAILDVQRLGGSRMESRSGVNDLRTRSKIRGGQEPGSGGRSGARAPTIPGYEVLELLGEGGMGVVYRARQKSLDRIVALKVLPPHAARETAFIKRFISEARTVARLNHENIIAGIDVGEADGTYYFAMEHVEGESVADMIERLGPLDERFALDVARQIARALEHAHKHGLVHRDVKPQNILVTRTDLAKLCDLGLAKMTSDASGDAGSPVGTPHYLSPEQARGDADVDIRSDIYSLGATLYHMLTGHTPFDGQSPMVLMTKHLTEEPVAARKRNPDVSKAASELVQTLMAKDKEDRHQTPTELLDDIERVLAGKKPSAAPSGRSMRASGSRRRRASGTSQPIKPASGGARESGLDRHARVRRGRLLAQGRGSETVWLLLIPLVVVSVIGAVVFMAVHPSIEFSDAPPTSGSDGIAAQALDEVKRARALQRRDPGAAQAAYRQIKARYPGTHAARMAQQYLDELEGGR